MPQSSEESTKHRREQHSSDPQLNEERQARDVPPPRETLPDSETSDQPKKPAP